jgi:MFS family permease
MIRLFTHRNVCIYLVGETISLFGDTALWLAMGIWVKSLTGSNAAAGLVFFVFAIPSLGAPLSGLLVDRVRRRPLLIITNLLIGAVVLLLLLVHNRNDIWLIYFVIFLYGISATLIGSAQSALLTVLVPEDLLGDANGVLQTIRQGLRLVGPLTGAGIFVWLGGGAVAIIDAVTFLAATIALAFVHVEEPQPESAEHHWVGEVLAGMKHVRDTIVLRQLVIAGALALLVVGFGETLIFAIVDSGLHRPPAFIGILTTTQGVGGLLGGLTAAIVMKRSAEGVLAGLGLLLLAFGTLLLIPPSLIIVLAGMILFGIGLPWLIVGVYTLVQRATPSQLQGRVYSAFDVLVGTPQTISIALGAALIGVVDYRLLLIMMAVVEACSAVYLLTRREQWKPQLPSKVPAVAEPVVEHSKV